jgi:hypothetical protein
VVIPEGGGSPVQGHAQPFRHGKTGEGIQNMVHSQ